MPSSNMQFNWFCDSKLNVCITFTPLSLTNPIGLEQHRARRKNEIILARLEFNFNIHVTYVIIYTIHIERIDPHRMDFAYIDCIYFQFSWCQGEIKKII